MEILQNLFGTDLKTALIVVMNLILIECLLSIDNAAVLATMVLDLPAEQRGKALKYGILGAYFFRGLSLIFAAFLVKVLWLKALGGLYLLGLCFKFFCAKSSENCPENNLNKNQNLFYKNTIGLLGPFWATVALVEIMDLAFSIDNVFAAVAFTNKIGLICLGVFIGILAMRFAAQFFVDLMEKFPFLEKVAFAVIGLLGFKLVFSYFCNFKIALPAVCELVESHKGDLFFSIITILMFTIPVLFSILKNKKTPNSREL